MSYGVTEKVVRVLQQQAALLARGARRHDSRKSEVSAVAEDLLNASHSHKYASGGDPPFTSDCINETRHSPSSAHLCSCNVQGLAASLPTQGLDVPWSRLQGVQ